MIARGRSIYANSATAGNLTRYLLHNPKNEQAIFLGAHGTAFPGDLEKSIDQMIWRAEDSKSQKPLYFTALSPDLKVDKDLTEEEWEFMRYTQAKNLGLEGQPYAWVQHQAISRNGELRIHRHVVYQRFDAEKECVISDEYERRKNRLACAEIEEKLGHERTFQRWTLDQIKERELAEQQKKIEADKKRQIERAEKFKLNLSDVADKQAVKMPELDEAALAYEKMKQRIKEQQEKERGYGY